MTQNNTKKIHEDFRKSRIIEDDQRLLDMIKYDFIMTPARSRNDLWCIDDIQRAKNDPNGNLTQKSPVQTVDSSFLVFAHLPPFDRSFNLHMLETLEAISHLGFELWERNPLFRLMGGCTLHTAHCTGRLSDKSDSSAGAGYWVIDQTIDQATDQATDQAIELLIRTQGPSLEWQSDFSELFKISPLIFINVMGGVFFYFQRNAKEKNNSNGSFQRRRKARLICWGGSQERWLRTSGKIFDTTERKKHKGPGWLKTLLREELKFPKCILVSKHLKERFDPSFINLLQATHFY